MRDGQLFQAGPHALDRNGPSKQGLFGEDAQELITAIPVDEVSSPRMFLGLGRDSLKGLIASLVDRRCRCRT